MSSKALVIGKFMPFHKGHKALIDFAAIQSKNVKILVLSHDKESISGEQRAKWIKESYDVDYSCNAELEIKVIHYDASQLNSSSESDIKSSQEWCDFLKTELEDITIIVGSEKYVQYMAEYANKYFAFFDIDREQIPISASKIKENPLTYWDYLTPAVKRTYAHHICICGTESSGKTTLSTLLEKKFDYVTMIPEIGRCLVGNAVTCEKTTLYSVLSIHKTLLKKVKNNPPTPIIVWDTDNLTTASYLKYFFNDIYDMDVPLADIYFFLDNNIPYEKDATRVEEFIAKDLKNHHLNIYKERGIKPYILKDKEMIKESMIQYVQDIADNICSKFWT